MARQRIMQTYIRKILKLCETGKSIRWISRELDIHRKTVSFDILRFKELNISSNELSQKTDQQLRAQNKEILKNFRELELYQ